MDDLIEVGALRGAYGFRGWVRVVPLGDGAALQSARDWYRVTPGQPAQALELEGVRRHGGIWVAKWKGCDSKEAADAIRGTIAVPRSSFPELGEGEYYWVDLIGSSVVNREGATLGTVRNLQNNGAQDLLEIEDPEGTVFFIPMVPTYVDRVDTAAKAVYVDWSSEW